MNGGWKVALATFVCVIGLAALNLSMWRRARAAVAEGRRREAGADDPAPANEA